LAAGLEDGDPLKPFEDIALGASGAGGGAETVVLRHKSGIRAFDFGRAEEEIGF